MELVINIPKEQYMLIMQSNNNSAADFVSKEAMMYAIKNGIPLLERHGKLVDVNSIPEEDRDITVKSLLRPGTIACVGAITLEEYVNGLPTIVEADKPKNGCCSCPHSGSIIDGYRDCPDAYTKQSQYCGFYNKGGN